MLKQHNVQINFTKQNLEVFPREDGVTENRNKVILIKEQLLFLSNPFNAKYFGTKRRAGAVNVGALGQRQRRAEYFLCYYVLAV